MLGGSRKVGQCGIAIKYRGIEKYHIIVITIKFLTVEIYLNMYTYVEDNNNSSKYFYGKISGGKSLEKISNKIDVHTYVY